MNFNCKLLNNKLILFLFTLLALINISNAVVLENLIKQKKLTTYFENKKIGYYLGSFDPLHIGHEEVVKIVLEKSLCDYILVCPLWGIDDGYKKRIKVDFRLKMVYEVFANHPKVITTCLSPASLQQLLVDIPDNGAPMARYNSKYIGIIGSDTASSSWVHDNEKIYMHSIKIPLKHEQDSMGGLIALPIRSFIVTLRNTDDIGSLGTHLGARPFTAIVKTNNLKCRAISSSKIKELIKNNNYLEVENCLNPLVLDIIKENKLYQI